MAALRKPTSCAYCLNSATAAELIAAFDVELRTVDCVLHVEDRVHDGPDLEALYRASKVRAFDLLISSEAKFALQTFPAAADTRLELLGVRGGLFLDGNALVQRDKYIGGAGHHRL